jgi:hypothetical protein
VSGYTHLSGGSSSSAPRRRTTYGPTKAQVAAHERELKAAQRNADIEKVKALEASLVRAHHRSFPPARLVELPPPDAVDSSPIEERLAAESGIPELIANLGGGESPPLAADPEPVDRYELMRDHRKRERQGVPIYRVGERIAAARRADQAAALAADTEFERRLSARDEDQQRLNGLWQQLGEARARVAERLPIEVGAERARRDQAREAEQAKLEADWARLEANDPMTTMTALEEAFADNSSPAAPINCEHKTTTVVMQFPQPEDVVPERKPDFTPTGKPTLKKRNKTEINELYVRALASNVLATVKEAFAVAPGTELVQMLVVRREIDKKHAGNLAAVYIGEFHRESSGTVGVGDLRAALVSAPEAELVLKGKTEQVAPLDLRDRPDLQGVLGQVAEGLES